MSRVASHADLEQRMTALEAEVARLKQQSSVPVTPWWERIIGAFADDPHFEEAMRLGREYRESLGPRGKGRKLESRPKRTSTGRSPKVGRP